ncbi:hypothetical protein Emin_0939 [Elusimicrobium minutum Pei191]|uniref:DUF4376 domain-containing protein n=1 Tax=Elusimicrobium minutum (strain Pei191) TaxID=445932 RepID=B2KD96_ELUMP|nr:DUF4376 domain-containing protein [Elusimicrobium minutum]ACC98492.1 hypothetical protein Emin_0939 [Elusimicrobium minutum Pei191]
MLKFIKCKNCKTIISVEGKLDRPFNDDILTLANDENTIAGEVLCAECQSIEDEKNKSAPMPEPTEEELFEHARQNKLACVKVLRDQKEQGGFEYLGKVFDSDTVSAQRLSLAGQTASICIMQNHPFSVVWTVKDNSTIELTAEQLLGAILALTMHANKCHQEASELKEKINKAETLEELEAIEL